MDNYQTLILVYSRDKNTFSDSFASTLTHESKDDKRRFEAKGDTQSVQDTPTPITRPPSKGQTIKPLIYGKHVEQKCRELLNLRQMCNKAEDFERLHLKIDNLIEQAIEKGKQEIEIRLLFEKAKVLHFSLDLEEALKWTNHALTKTKTLTSADAKFQLQLIGKFVQVSIHSRKGDHGRAWGMLKLIQSDLNSNSTDFVDHWRFHYNKGSYYLARLRTSNLNDDRVCNPGVEEFTASRRAIVNSENNNQPFHIQEHFFGLVMCAKLLLNLPEHAAKRDLTDLSKDRIMKAQSFLQLILSDYPFHQMVIRFLLRFLITVAGLFYRRGQRYKRDFDESEAKCSFIDAMLFLEYASLLGKGSLYEESKMIHEFLEYLKGKCFASSFHTDLEMGAGMFTFRTNKTSSDDHALNEPESEGFTSDDFGNPTGYGNTRKRRTKKAAAKPRTKGTYTGDMQMLTADTQHSPGALQIEPYASHSFYALHNVILFHLITETSFTNASMACDDKEGDDSEVESSAELFRVHKEYLPENEYPRYQVPHHTDYCSSETLSSESETTSDISKSTYEPSQLPDDSQQILGHKASKCSILTRNSICAYECGVKQSIFDVTSRQRKVVRFEIKNVQEYVNRCRTSKNIKTKEQKCVPILVSAKFALDFPETAIGQQRFIVTLEDLIAASNAIKVIKEVMPVYADPNFKAEFLLLMCSFYFRCAQLAIKLKCVTTCKLCLNLAQLYSNFAVMFTKENCVVDKTEQCIAFHERITCFAKSCEKKKDFKLLIPT